jgi:hypothetical protein
MKTFQTLLRWSVWMVGLGVIILAVLWGLSRLQGATAEELAAMALLEVDQDFAGENAFDYLWLLQYDMPEDDHLSVLAEDMRRLEQWIVGVYRGETVSPPFVSVAAERYADLRPEADEMARFCAGMASDCLARVRADQDGYRALLDRHQRLLERASRATQAEYLDNYFAPRLLAPTPSYQLAILPATGHALAFIEGDIDAALARTCEQIADWNRLGRNTDHLIARIIASTFVGGLYAHLLTDFLAELPPGYALPEQCRLLERPPAPETLSLCPAMRGEYRQVTAGTQDLLQVEEAGRLLERAALAVTFRQDLSAAMLAPQYAQWCAPEMLAALMDDDPDPGLDEPGSVWQLRCIANWTGCVMNLIAMPDMSRYYRRQLDHGARMHALALALWLHGQADDGPDELPADLVHGRVRITDAGIVVELLDSSQADAVWSLPLPSSRWSPSD